MPRRSDMGMRRRGRKSFDRQATGWYGILSAPNVHDFMWAADPDYHHLVRRLSDGRVINVLYKNQHNDPRQDTLWNNLADAAVMVLPYIEKTFGAYPYKQYSFVHGGDGGMEYPMSTLINGPSIGTAFHEWMHSWYQGMMGTNESMYAWMDEGFTTYAERPGKRLLLPGSCAAASRQ